MTDIVVYIRSICIKLNYKNLITQDNVVLEIFEAGWIYIDLLEKSSKHEMTNFLGQNSQEVKW